MSRAAEGDHGGRRADAPGGRARSALFGPPIPYLAAHLENLGLVYDLGGFPDSNVARPQAGAGDAPGGAGRRQSGHRPHLFNLAVAEYRRRDYAAAEPLYEEAPPACGRAYGPEHPDVVYATAAWAGTSTARPCHRCRAEPAMGARSEGSRRPVSARPPPRSPAGGHLLLDQRRWAEAEPIALRLLAIRDSLADTLARQTAEQLVTLYEGWGKPDRAAEYRGGQRRRATPMRLRIRA